MKSMDTIDEILEKIRENALGCKAPCSQNIVHLVNQIITARNEERFQKGGLKENETETSN